MEVSLNANMCDAQTRLIAQELHGPFKVLSRNLTGSYGGVIEHLWIDFELIPAHAALRPPRAFRFQKRVAPPAMLKGLGLSHCQNVGHYSVRQDFGVLLQFPMEQVAAYALRLIYESTVVLTGKQKRLGPFDPSAFRSSFLKNCRKLGYEVSSVGSAR
jgi:hypothetical protein